LAVKKPSSLPGQGSGSGIILEGLYNEKLRIRRMKMAKSGKSVHEFEDTSFVAFLALRGHHYTPQKKPNGRVAFEIEGDVARDVEAFYLNQSVGVLEFCQILKTVRNSIFNLKALR
jgi:hypothetical protein